jgi:signal transduction histidine kinase
MNPLLYPFRYLCFIAFAFVLYSCNSETKLNGRPQLSQSDSTTFNHIDSIFMKAQWALTKKSIDSIVNTKSFKNNKLFRLKMLELEAKNYLKLNEPQLALDKINQIIFESEYEREEYNNQFVSATLLKGYIYFGLGDYRSAYKYFYQARESDYGKGENCEFAIYNYRIAMSLYRQMKYKEAILDFKKSFNNYKRCEDNDFWTVFKHQEILNNIGLCFFQMQQFDSSIFYYDSALAYIKETYKLKDVYPESLEVATGVIMGNKGKAYMALKQYDIAIDLLNKNININSKEKYDKRDAVTSRIALANYYLQTKNYTKFNQAVAIPEVYYTYDHFKKQLVFIYELKYKYFEQIKRLDSALHYHKLYEETKEILLLEKQKINDSDVQLSLESLERENELNKISKENQKRKYYINITVYLTIGFFLLTIIIYLFLRNAYRNNQKLKASNDEVLAQRELLKNANEVLKERDKEKNKILSIVAHDLRNPTNAIHSIATTMKEDDNLTSEQLEFLDLIEQSAVSNKGLIQEILQFAKPGQFDSAKEYKVLSCHDFLLKCIAINKIKASEKEIDLVYEEADPQFKININQEKLKRVISNLINNAIKFSNRNSQIIVFCSHTDTEITIHIRDFGIGIPDHLKDILFKSDPKIRRAGTDGEESFGLGLAIVKQIIEDHNGTIRFISEGKGTEFLVTLNLYKQ